MSDTSPDTAAGPPHEGRAAVLLRGPFKVLRHPAFRAIWLGALVSNVGNWMEGVGQSWEVQRQTGSPFLVELLASSEFIPSLLLTLFAGHLADRLDRRKLVLWGQAGLMVQAAVLAALAHFKLASATVIIVVSFLEGAAWTLVQPAWQALMPSLVPREELPQAIALNSAQFNVARLSGPVLAGAILAVSSAAFVFDLNALSFVAILAALFFVRIDAAITKPKHDAVQPFPEKESLAEEERGVKHAIRWALTTPGPRRLLLGISVFSFLAAPVQGLMAVYADDLLHVGPHGYGFLLGSLGFGALCGALSLSQLPKSYPRHHLIPLSMVAYAMAAVAYGFSQWMLLSCAALAVAGVFWVWSLSSSSTAMQLLVPERLRGRGLSVLTLATMGPLPMGHLLAGAIAHQTNARVAVVGFTILLAVFAMWASFSREPGIDGGAKSANRKSRDFLEEVREMFTAESHRS
ncbi:MAG: MFS transporter [Deltaproteobacteria bacterium]|nr:MFS transporter [Deltaproteobacteria bacterium]